MGNYELDVLLHDPVLGGRLEAQFRRDMARSGEVELHRRGGGRTLERAVPEQPDPLAAGPPVRRFRERRRRTGLAVRGLASAARRSVFGPVALGLTLIGLLLLVLPQTMALIIAGLCGWLAVGAGFRAFRARLGS